MSTFASQTSLNSTKHSNNLHEKSSTMMSSCPKGEEDEAAGDCCFWRLLLKLAKILR